MTGKVTIPRAAGFAPEPHEVATALRLAALGFDVTFLVPSRARGVKTPGIVLDGRWWETKSPRGSGAHTISAQLRRAGHQADRLVLDTARTPLSDAAIETEVRRRLPVTSLVEVLILGKDGTAVHVFRS